MYKVMDKSQNREQEKRDKYSNKKGRSDSQINSKIFVKHVSDYRYMNYRRNFIQIAKKDFATRQTIHELAFRGSFSVDSKMLISYNAENFCNNC